jgi:predicted dehydrogenase
MSIRFAAIGLNHGHIYGICRQLLDAGAELVGFYAPEPDLASAFAERYPHVKQAASAEELLEDPSIHLIASAAIPDERGPLGIKAMQHGKDYVVDKPGFVSLAQLAEARRVQAETERIYSVYFSERLGSRASQKVSELLEQGVIGDVVHMTGMGPHRIGQNPRPDWFWEFERFGGILNDIGSHQIDQYLAYSGATEVEVVFSQVANFHHPEHPTFQDFGDLILRSPTSTAHIRVDWFSPNGLGVFGDARLFLIGTDGYIEARKIIDIAGRSGGNHVFVANESGVEYIDCNDVHLPYGDQLIQDVLNRTETAMTQEHCFLTCELILKAQVQAAKLGHLAG